MPAFFLFHRRRCSPAPPSDRLNPPEPQPQLQPVPMDELGSRLFHNSTLIAPSRPDFESPMFVGSDPSVTACEAVIAQSSPLLPLPLEKACLVFFGGGSYGLHLFVDTG